MSIYSSNEFQHNTGIKSVLPRGIEHNGNTSPREFKSVLAKLSTALNSSGEVDAIGMWRFFTEWEGMDNFTEEDDPYLNIIDSYMKLSGNFESNAVSRSGFDVRKIENMGKSVELQRAVINQVSSCISFSPTGDVIIDDLIKFQKIVQTFEFIDNFSRNIMNSKNRISHDSMLKSFSSGIRSMVCASCLIRATESSIYFSKAEYDLKFDLDIVAVDKMGRRHAFDVTTQSIDDTNAPPKLKFSYFKVDKFSRIPADVMNEEHLDRSSKLVLPSLSSSPDFFSKLKGARLVGIPAPYYVRSFVDLFNR